MLMLGIVRKYGYKLVTRRSACHELTMVLIGIGLTELISNPS